MVTNFPNKGDNEKTLLYNSKYPIFNYDVALEIKDEHPGVWTSDDGHINCECGFTNDESFEMWSRYRAGERSEPVLQWVCERENVLDNFDGDDFVALIKWGYAVNGDLVKDSIENLITDKAKSIKVNTFGLRNAKSLISSGKIDSESPWSFSPEDGNKLLGSNKNNFSEFAKWHLAEDTSKPEKTKERYKYPFGKDGKIWRRGVIAAKSRAAQQNQTNIINVADELLTMINKKIGKKDSGCQRYDLLEVISEGTRANWLESVFEKTDEGFLSGRSVVTNIGVFPYLQADGSVRRELRLPEEVFHPDSIRTLKLKPLSNEHPDEMISPLNISEYQVGNLGDDILTDPYHVSAPIIITDSNAIEDVLAGKRALSMGYKTDIEETAGTWMGIPYDAIQRNIRYNHCAIVNKGRAGDAAIMRVDSDDWTFPHKLACSNGIQTSFKGDAMKQINIDGVDYQAEAPVITAYTKLKTNFDSMEGELTIVKTKVSTLEAERDTLKEKLDASESEMKELQEKSLTEDQVSELIEKKMRLIKLVDKTGFEVKDEMSDEDIIKGVITTVFPKAVEKLDGATDAYLESRLDAVEEELEFKADEDKHVFSPQKQKSGLSVIKSDASHQNFVKRYKERT